MDPFVEAAKRIHSGKHVACCFALDQPFDEAFAHAARECSGGVSVENGKFGYWNLQPTPRRQQIRVLALLFAAQFERTGDL